MHNPTLPADFDPQVYLRLHPDVAAAGVDPAQHYLDFGMSEKRPYHENQHLDQSSDFVFTLPTDQTIIDIFQGEWSSAFPTGSGLIARPGFAQLFADHRIEFADAMLGPFSGMSICELGPLEGGHTYMLHERGARSIDAVEVNKDAFLKCLCVKEVFGLNRARFHLGDATTFLEQNAKHYDIIIASGILYHMVDPIRLLRAMTERADRLYIWTHYYDADVFAQRGDRDLFQPRSALDDEGRYYGSKRLYPATTLSWAGFSGGVHAHAVWLERATIDVALRDCGFTRIAVQFDDKSHQNGPEVSIAARR